MVAPLSTPRSVVATVAVVVIGIASTAAVAIHLRSATGSSAASPLVANFTPTRPDERCGKALINDVCPDRQLGHVYSRGCFEAALGTIPATGVLVYSTVREDIVTSNDRQVGSSSSEQGITPQERVG